MSSEHDQSRRGGSLEDIRVDDVEIESPLRYNLRQLKERWKAFLMVFTTAVTAYTIYWVEGEVMLDVLLFAILSALSLVYTLVMIRSDLEME